MRKLWCIFLPVLFLGPLLIHAQEETPPVPQLRRELVPQTWERKVPAGTALAAIKERYETRLATRMLATDLEDQSPLPFWFRAYLRDQHPSLPTTGKYQYLLVSEQILDWMVAHPDLKIPPGGAPSRQSILPPRWITVGTNINISNLSAINSESAVAVDYSNPQYVIAASNNISGTGRQKQFRSSDYGANWTKTELPLAPGSAFDSDPAVAFTTNGTAWAATLGINATGTVVQVQVYKSTDHGATWTYNTTLSSGNSNDKEMMWIDNYPSSPFKDSIYVVWDVPGGGMRFRRSPDGGKTWGNIITISSDSAIGSHVTTGPRGEIYVAWPDTASRELRIRKSTDGGATFSAARVIAKTNDSYEISIPSFCSRKALIYVSLGVDRSNGPHKGDVYAAWTDRNGTDADPGCTGTTSDSNTNVYVSASTDAGQTWSTPKVIHTDVARTDQFNQWLDVDPTDGSVHVIFYDTRNDSNRKKTDIYYVKSSDGGSTWRAETKVTTLQTDETVTGADLANQYGDYNGLAVFQNFAHPVWTDRRTGTPGNHEQIYTASVQEKSIKPPFTICDAHPQLCQSITHLPGSIVLACTTKPCLNFDHFPDNCTRKFTCPGCPPGGLCPPYYNFYLDDPLPDWQVSLLGPKGEKVDYKLSKTARGLVLSFRPSKELYQEGSIGDYFVQFKPGPSVGVKTQKRVKVRLEVSDKPYSPPK